MKKDVSIIIPVYNAEKYIKKCLTSIKKQTFKNYEIVLVNDGSTDKSVEVCKKFKTDNENMSIKVYSKKNGGPSSARNYGIKKAIGKYICFVDSDDYLDKKYLDNLLKDIDDNDFVITGFTDQFKEFSKFVKPVGANKSYSSDEIAEILIENVNLQIFNPPYSKLYKLSIIKEHDICFDENVRMGEDFIFNISYLKHCKNILLKDDSDYIYNHINENALTNKFDSNRWSIEKKLFKTYESYFKSAKVYDKYSKYINEYIIMSLNKTTYTVINTTLSKKEKLKYIKKMFNDPIFKGRKISCKRTTNKIVKDLLKFKNYRLMYYLVLYKLSKER